MAPATRYAKNGSVHIAYQEWGAGDLNLVVVPGFMSHVELIWSYRERRVASNGLVRSPGLSRSTAEVQGFQIPSP